MPTTKKGKWQKKKKPICKKFKTLVERTREETEAFWDLLALPKRKPILRKPKKKTRIQTDKQYSKACREVDERDNHTCQHPGCNCRITQHHHGVYRSRGGKDDVRNLISLCWKHHTGSRDSPHQSEEWRRYWEEWLEKKYPAYWEEIREGKKIREKVQRLSI